MNNEKTFKDLLDEISDTEYCFYVQLGLWPFPQDSEEDEEEVRSEMEDLFQKYTEACRKYVDSELGKIKWKKTNIDEIDPIEREIYSKTEQMYRTIHNPYSSQIGYTSTISKVYNVPSQNTKMCFLTIGYQEDLIIYIITN